MSRKTLTVREKIAKSKIKVNPRYSATSGEIFELCKRDEPFEALSDAFCYGYIQGVKAAKAEAKGGEGMNELRDNAVKAIVEDIKRYENEAFSSYVLIPSTEISFAYLLNIIDLADFNRLRDMLEAAKKVNEETKGARV